METIILASASPRRAELLTVLGLPFRVAPSLVDESFEAGLEPRAVAEELALRKVREVVQTLKSEEAAWVCGGDTLIALDGKIYGKPKDRDDAGAMIRAFRRRTHEVISAVALYNGKARTTDCRSSISSVSFADMSDAEVEWYLDSGEWRGAAGAYKIQGIASCFIQEIKGSYTSIVGLPLREFYAMLRSNGYLYGG